MMKISQFCFYGQKFNFKSCKLIINTLYYNIFLSFSNEKKKNIKKPRESEGESISSHNKFNRI